MPETPPEYSGSVIQLQRIYEVTGCATQVDLAALLGIRQSSVSIITRQGKIPDKWLVRLFRLGVNPEWVLTGKGPSRIPDLREREEGEPEPRRPPDRVVIRNLLYCFPLDDLRAELKRRKADADWRE